MKQTLLKNPAFVQLVNKFSVFYGNLTCSQEPATGPYPDPNDSSSHNRTTFKIHFNIILPSTRKTPSGLMQMIVRLNTFSLRKYQFLWSAANWATDSLCRGLR
jgi:hypothetical protein